MPDAAMSDELKAMAQIEGALEKLGEDARSRVLRWAGDRFCIMSMKHDSGSKDRTTEQKRRDAAQGEYADLSEFYDAASSPSSDADRALVAAYWFQCHEEQTDVDSQKVNKELKHLGHGVGNITRAFNALIDQKPALIMQTRKEGTTKQARKKYRVTAEGRKRVESMLSGTHE